MSRWFSFALAAALMAAPAAVLRAQADATILEQVLIESATTPAQHAALANYYDAKAAAARKEAEDHRAMGAAYGGAKVVEIARMREHCDKLATLYTQQAEEFKALASMHRAKAK